MYTCECPIDDDEMMMYPFVRVRVVSSSTGKVAQEMDLQVKGKL
jgi:hypothetical protein